MVSCQKGLTRHAYAWQIGPFWQDTLEVSCNSISLITIEVGERSSNYILQKTIDVIIYPCPNLNKLIQEEKMGPWESLQESILQANILFHLLRFKVHNQCLKLVVTPGD